MFNLCADISPSCSSSTEGLWSRLSPDRTHRGEQVQHLRFGRVALQEEAHVCGTERQWKTNEGEKDTKEKHSHSLPAHCGTTTMMGRNIMCRLQCHTCLELRRWLYWTDLNGIRIMH